ncbi:MAG: DNA polymerase III subunit delta' [Kiloniellales bacterium]
MSGSAPPRPRETASLLGHEAAERRLLDAWACGRLPHAWLLTGPRGIGKATLAYRLARFLLRNAGKAESIRPPQGLAVDPEDPVFRRVASGGHADLVTVERAWDDKRGRRRGEIVVDDIRGVGAFLRLTPAEAGWRVVVVDSADEMNPNAANALLKCLEEPTERAVLLLISHAPGRLLATIRSRCRRLTLKPLSDQVVARIVKQHYPEMSAPDVGALAGLAEGSAGRALALAAEGGLAVYRELAALLNRLPAVDGEALHALGDKLARPGADALWQAIGELLRGWLVRAVRTGVLGPAGAHEAVAGEAEAMRRLAGPGPGAASGLDRWVEVWEKTDRLLGQSDTANLDRKQVLLDVFFALESAARSGPSALA